MAEDVQSTLDGLRVDISKVTYTPKTDIKVMEELPMSKANPKKKVPMSMMY